MHHTRREFMRNALAAGTLAAAGGAWASAAEEPDARTGGDDSNATDYDVAVVGAGTAGTIAAIQAGRLGLRTLLVEKNGMPGGTTIVAAVNFPGLFHAWGRQLIGGIGWELVSRAVELAGHDLHNFAQVPDRHWQHQLRVNRALYSSLACEELQQAGVDVLFHAMPADVEEMEDGVQLTVCAKTGLETVKTGALIDATGDANAIYLAGYPLNQPEELQPGTLITALTGYDLQDVNRGELEQAFQAALEDGVQLTVCTKTGLETVKTGALIDATGDANAIYMAGYPLNEPEELQPGTLITVLTGYDLQDVNRGELEQAFQAALEDGELEPEDEMFVRNNLWGFLSPGLGPGAFEAVKGDNATHIAGVNGRTSAGRTEAELNSRVSLLRVYRFLRRQPGLENFEISFVAPECGIRETATIRGEATVTAEDYESGRLWDDAVSYSFYPIDVHYPGGIRQRHLNPNTFPTIPRGALVPQGSRRLLVAGRCLSSDRDANSALRVQASCMGMGQAAAVLAGQAARQGISVMDTDMDEARAALREHGAIVPSEEGPPRV